MPSELGHFCLRCGAQCVITREESMLIYSCPRGHGEQRREAAPPEAPAAEAPPQDSGVDQVSQLATASSKSSRSGKQQEPHTEVQ
jgi:hypothetical protein